MEMLKAGGPDALRRFMQAEDPAGLAVARAKIGRKTATSNRERAAWDREHGPQDPDVFRSEILPSLAGVPTHRLLRRQV
jgi:hypothetical protein